MIGIIFAMKSEAARKKIALTIARFGIKRKAKWGASDRVFSEIGDVSYQVANPTQ